MFFLMPHSGHHFVMFLRDSVLKSSILGVSWPPAGPKVQSKIAQVALQIMKKLIGADNLEPTLQQGLVQYAPWHHFGRFGMDLG